MRHNHQERPNINLINPRRENESNLKSRPSTLIPSLPHPPPDHYVANTDLHPTPHTPSPTPTPAPQETTCPPNPAINTDNEDLYKQPYALIALKYSSPYDDFEIPATHSLSYSRQQRRIQNTIQNTTKLEISEHDTWYPYFLYLTPTATSQGLLIDSAGGPKRSTRRSSDCLRCFFPVVSLALTFSLSTETIEATAATEPTVPTVLTERRVLTEPTVLIETTEPIVLKETTVPTVITEPTVPTELTVPTETTEPTALTELTVPTEPAVLTLPTETTVLKEPKVPTMAKVEAKPTEAKPTEPKVPTAPQNHLYHHYQPSRFHELRGDGAASSAT
ncbi:zonadhesin-like [Penaeus indicus]|uniref:zonadhesin-like n=1 Tax=Penaeus indicus TaxID=29960 RepID=UPI00300D127E